MRYVSASEAKQRLAALLDAAQREPVTIRRQNRDVAVVISPTDYRRLTSIMWRHSSASVTALPRRRKRAE